MKTQYYKGLDRIIAKARKEKQIREIKKSALAVAKFFGCAFVIYGSFYIGWCALCAMFPTWP